MNCNTTHYRANSSSVPGDPNTGQVLDGFLNGIHSTTVTGARAMPTALYLAIGGTDTTNMGSGAYFNGLVDEVAVYSSALSNARIIAHYQAGKSAPLEGSPYASAVQSDFPAGYWRLGETSGTSAADSSGAGRNGTYVNSVTQGVGGALANDPAYSTRFNGTNSYVSLGNLSAYQVSSGTIEAWVETTTTAQSAIASKLNAWWFGVQATGKLGFYDMGGGAMRDSGVVVNDGRWHQVAVTFQSGVALGSQMYVDGRPAGSPFQMTISNQTIEFEIAGYNGSQMLNGAVEDVSFYPVVLSKARISAHYQAAWFGAPAPTGTDLSTYSATVSADRPVGYWRLGEASGQATDASGNNHTSTVANVIGYGVAGAIAADGDTAMTFNGTSSYLSIPYTASLAPSPAISLEVWFNAAALPSVAAILLDTENSTFAKGAKINFDTTGHAAFQIDPGSVVSSGVLSLNTWHHVVATYDGTYMRLYVDGAVVAGPTAATYVANDGGAITIGAITNGSSNFFNGILDEAAIYNYALTPARVTAHFMAATDLSQRRVYSVQDALGSTVASIAYNDDTAITQVINARGLPAYYTFQQYGGRTLSVTDTANDTTRYEYDGGAAYRLMATVSPTGIRQSKFMNTGAPVGQQGQMLMSDSSSQPSTVTQTFMSGALPNVYTYGTSSTAGTSESWVWDSTLTVQLGVASHRSTPGVSGAHHHDVTFTTGVFIPAGAQITQWVYLEPGVQLPGNLALQVIATDGTSHRAFWGMFSMLGGACPSSCFAGPMPTAGRWVQLTAPLGPAEGVSPQVDLDMANRTVNQIQFTVVGGTGSVWWGPTSFQFPAPSVTDPTRAVSRYVYNATNDQIASVDPNGIAQISDVDSTGLTRASSSGIEPAPVNLLTDPVSSVTTWLQEFGYAGTSSAAVTTPQHNGIGTISQTHTGAGLQSDLYKDVTGLSPGTYVQVSVWVQTQANAVGGAGGASLAVENHLAVPNNAQRRSASVQTAGQWVQLTLPFIVDGAGQIRIHLWQENFQGITYWADLRVDDITPAPDITLQHPLAVYSSGFEIADAAWTLGNATRLTDATQAHTGLNSIKDTIANNNTTNTVSRTLTISTSATYRVSAWVRTSLSGSGAGSGGAVLCAQFSGSTCATAVKTEGQWQQQTVTIAGTGTLTIQLSHQNFQGTVYWDDINVERVADQTPATTGSWKGTGWAGSLQTGGSATWASSWTGGVGGGPSRQVSVTATGTTTDVADTLSTSALRAGASYVFSLWLGSTAVNSSVTVSGPNLSLTCLSLQTTPTLCQGSFVYTGGDKAPQNFIIYYGGQGARTVNVSHPLIALQTNAYNYTAYGQVTLDHDVFGHATATTYDANSLYPTQTVITATPSPNLTTNDQYNSLGQLILSTRVNGASSIATQTWVDSWGRQVGSVSNCTPAAPPPTTCTGAADAATNVMTRAAFDLNGNIVDMYTQGQVSGTWVDTHYVYNANNKRIAEIQNCVTTSNPCDGASSPSQNVVNAFAYDQLNNLVDTFSPLPGCTGVCVPIPSCSAGPPLTCPAPAAPCPATCVDSHIVYDLAGRVYQQIANYNGTGNASQANVTTTYAYDADGRVVDTLAPISSATLQTGQIDEHKVYDGIGRLVTDIRAYAVPVWMSSVTVSATTASRTDYTLDPGGRTVSVTGPGTGALTATNRIVTTTDYSDLGTPLSVTADTSGMQAVTKSVYDTANNAIHTWTPTTQKLGSIGLETTTVHDLNGQITSVVKDDIGGGLRLTTTTTYDGYGRPTDVVDPRGIDTHTTYDALDRPTSVTSNYCPSGNSNPNCNGSSILSDQNVTTSYVYDLAGNRTQVVNARGIIEFTAYDALGRATFVTEDCASVPAPGGTSCGTQSSDQNVLTSTTYDQTGGVLATTDALGRVNVFAYDALGRKVSETDNCVGSGGACNGGPTSGQNLVSTWQVDAAGDVLVQLSPRSCTSTSPCYQGGTGLTATDGNPLATAYTYDGLLRLVSVTEDQSSASGHYINPNVLVTSYAYDPSGHKLTMTDGLGNVTHYGLDNLGRVISVKDPLQNNVQTTFSLAGEVTSTIDARGKTNANTLDDVGRVVVVTYLRADNVTTATQSFGYDADGNKTCFSDGATSCSGNTTTTTYDHLNRVSTVTSPAPLGTTSYAYFMDGAEQSVTDATGTTNFTEDRLGRLATMADPLNPSSNIATTYTYDAAGRLVTRAESATPPSGAWAFVQAAATPDTVAGAVTATLTLATTAGDSLIIVSASEDPIDGFVPTVTGISDNGTTHATYLKAVASSDNCFTCQGLEIWYADNIPAGITHVTVTWSGYFQGSMQDGRIEVSEYHGLLSTGSLDKVATKFTNGTTAPTGTTPTTTATNDLVVGAVAFSSLAISAPTGWNARSGDSSTSPYYSVADENGATQAAYSGVFTYKSSGSSLSLGAIATFKSAGGGPSTGVVTTASYTGADQIASKTEVSGSTTLASWTGVTYDQAQNRTSETLTYYTGNPYPDPQAGTSTYQYDTVDQLSQANLPGKTVANFGYDTAHNLTSNAGVAQTYNTNESLQTACGVTIGAPDADGNQLKDCAGNALSWNSLSQLEKFSTTETYTYDAIGRLVKVANGSTATQFVYRGLSSQVVEELDVNGSVIRSYSWDSSGRQLYVKSGSNVYYEITDLHGDVVALATTTALVGTAHFDPWGNLVASAGTTIPFGFQGSDGSWTDAVTGFVHMGARWYYPKDTLFLSSDPAAGTADPRTPMGGLRWVYGQDNPVIQSDPTGLRIIADGGWGSSSSTTDLCDRDSCPGSPQSPPTVYNPPAKPKPPAPCDFWCHAKNGWNAATQIVNVRPDAGGVQDNLIALGNHMDSGWKQRYRDTLSSSADWVNGTRGDLVSGDPYRIARGTVGVVMFASNFVPGAGEGVTLVEDAGKVAATELVEHAPQLEHAVTEAIPQAERGLTDLGEHSPAKDFVQEAPSSRKLGQNLEDAGTVRPDDTAAHHIVAGSRNNPDAAAARKILDDPENQIGINSAENGVFLPKNTNVANPIGAVVHSTVHTNDYYRAVNQILSGAQSRDEVIAALDYIRSELLAGRSLVPAL